MVVSKAELKRYSKEKLKLRVAAKALELLKNELDNHEDAEKVLEAASKLAKELKKSTILESHVRGVLAGYKLCMKKE